MKPKRGKNESTERGRTGQTESSERHVPASPKSRPPKSPPKSPSKSPSPELPSSRRGSTSDIPRSLTLWNYLVLELTDTHYTIFSHDKVEHLINVIKVPFYEEHVVMFGVLTCLDSFLHTFTILPLRALLSIYRLVTQRSTSTARRADAIKGFILVAVFAVLLRLDTSKIYHNIRGQAAIKLYVTSGVLEIADKLCSAMGHDIMECLFSLSTLTSTPRLLAFTLMVLIYCFIHSMVILYQVITLNVAVNSYSNALLTLLLSNQFAEIKSSVFKKFEREELFQLTCADITERFQMLVILLVIGVRNIVEVDDIGVIPASWDGWNRWLGALLGPAIVVAGSEIIVDGIKHAYISKFNNLKPRIYHKFLDVLAVDYVDNAFSDQVMTRRAGFPVYPLALVSAKMLLQSYQILIERESYSAEYAGDLSYLATTTAPVPGTTNAAVDLGSSFMAGLQSLGAFMPSWITNISLPAIPSAISSVLSQPLSSQSPISSAKSFDFLPSLKPLLQVPTLPSLSVVIAGLAAFVVLLFLKLVLGVLLLRYASQRHALVRRLYAEGRKMSARDYDNVPAPGALDEKLRQVLYDPDEEVPVLKDPSQKTDGFMDLINVTRFRIASKRIW